jgi:CSLREA domain-containing protein
MALGLGLLGAIGVPTTARAATLTVTTTADELNADGDCSLREAVRAANLNSAVDACPAGIGPDTIALPAGTYQLMLDGAEEDAAATGDFDLTSDVTIQGAGAATTLINGAWIDRLIDVRSGATAVISGVTIYGGAGRFEGGGIMNRGTLTVIDSWLSSNNASSGGGVMNHGTLTVTNSRINSNEANDGAGMYNTGTLTINSSTVNFNEGQDQGVGIWNGGALTLNNSTVSQNFVDGDEQNAPSGGGIANSGALTLNNSTVTGNWIVGYSRGCECWIGVGGGIYGSFTARNSIIAGNSSASASDCYGVMTAQAPNLLGLTDGCTIVGAGVAVGDPLLAPLRDNGGPTPTHALLPGSPAIDAGDNATCLATDQRGVARPQDGDGNGSARCDIGAVERQNTLLINGGFETDSNADGAPDGWSSNSRAARSSAVVHSGGYALRHRATDNASYTIFSDPSGPVVPGRVYSFTGWVNIPPTSDAFSFELQVRWRDAGGNVLSTIPVTSYTAATSGWTSVTTALIAPANAAQATIRQVVGSLNATIYVDDLNFHPVDNLVSNPGFETSKSYDPLLPG